MIYHQQKFIAIWLLFLLTMHKSTKNLLHFVTGKEKCLQSKERISRQKLNSLCQKPQRISKLKLKAEAPPKKSNQHLFTDLCHACRQLPWSGCNPHNIHMPSFCTGWGPRPPAESLKVPAFSWFLKNSEAQMRSQVSLSGNLVDHFSICPFTQQLPMSFKVSLEWSVLIT